MNYTDHDENNGLWNGDLCADCKDAIRAADENPDVPTVDCACPCGGLVPRPVHGEEHVDRRSRALLSLVPRGARTEDACPL